MRKNILTLGVMAALLSGQSVASGNCGALTGGNFLSVYGDPQPLSGIADQALKNTGWTLEYSQASAEPMINGTVKGSVESVIVGLVSKSIKKGWRINLSFEKERCKVKIDVLNEQAPDMTQGLTSKGAVTGSIAPSSPTTSPEMTKSLVVKNRYRASKGMTLEQILDDWAKMNGGSGVWEHDKNITLGADAEFVGSLANAVSGLIESIGDSGKQITVHVYKNGFIRTIGAK